MTEHAKHAPSSIYLTVACPGWQRQASLLPPEQPTEATREGELGHAVAAAAASGLALPPNGVEITEEMLDGAAVWAEALEGYPAKIETRVTVPSVHPTDCWGTPDARQWAPETKTHRAADYKYGHGFVDEFENWQLLTYTIGSIDEAYSAWRSDPSVKFEMTVVQPRYYNGKPIRTWAIQTAGLLHYEARLRSAVQESESANPRVISGTHCTHCPARATCHVYQKTAMGAVDFAGRPDPMVSAPEDVGRELRVVQEYIKRLEARETGLSALAEAMIRGGKRVPNFALEQSAGRLAWTMDIAVVEMTAQMQGKTIMAPAKPITPTQAKQRRLLADAVVSQYSDRPKGAFKLVPVSTKPVRSFSQ